MKSKDEINRFVKLMVQLQNLSKEFDALSQKKPNDPINKFKLSLMNPLLETANQIIDEKNRPFADFDMFSEDALPTNSDVLMVLSQYLGCLEKFRRENTAYVDGHHWWRIGGKASNERAPHPDKA